MSAEKKYTERELVLAQREAYALALCPGGIHGGRPCPVCKATAKRRYPLPRVTRPRVVSDGTLEWQVLGGVFMWRYVGSEWQTTCLFNVDAARVALWADLLANPTETVEEGE